jgi:hypothetical protein
MLIQSIFWQFLTPFFHRFVRNPGLRAAYAVLATERKTLSVRLHECPKCNLEMDRDENAAINILYKGLTAVGLMVAAYRRLSSCTPEEVGIPISDVGKLSLYS